MNRRILQLAVPNIVSNLSVPLLGAVDAILMGHQPGAERFLSAIAIATAIFNFLYWGFGFLRMGTTGLTAQAFGAEDMKESLLILGRGLTVAAGGSVLILLLQSPIASAGLWLMEGSDAAKEIASSYFDIRILAAPATLGLYALHGWFLGMQNALIPMVLSIAVNIFNIGFNLLFVYGFDMQAEGIAWGTVLAQYIGLLLAIGLFVYNYRHLFAQWQPSGLFQLAALKHFFMVNGDIMIRTLCLVFVFNFFLARSGTMGDEMLAANALLLQLLYIMSYIVDGFAFAAESLVGRFVGAENPAELRKAIKGIFRWGMGFGLVFSLVYLVSGPLLLSLFTSDVAVYNLSLHFLPWMVLMPIWGTYSFMWDGIYLGATASAPMRNSMLISTFAIFLPSWYLLEFYWGNHGLWLAFSLFMVFRGFTLAFFAKKHGLR